MRGGLKEAGVIVDSKVMLKPENRGAVCCRGWFCGERGGGKASESVCLRRVNVWENRARKREGKESHERWIGKGNSDTLQSINESSGGKEREGRGFRVKWWLGLTWC